jgi:hypothetical protein
LHYAACGGHAAVVGVLVGGGAAVGSVTGGGETALHEAAYKGHAAVVEALAGAGAGVNAATNDGFTPLSVAACHGKTEAAAALLGAGADATRPTFAGKTAAEWARQQGHAAVAQLIEVAAAAAEAAAARPTVAGLMQGLGFLSTHRVDLSDTRFGDVRPEQALDVAVACGRKLDALFLPVPLALPPEIVAQLKEKCPEARCLALGGEVTAVGFEEILRQCKESDAELTEALGLTATPIAEGVPPPLASSTPDPEVEYRRSSAKMEPELEDAAPRAAAPTYVLDLTDVMFQHLADAGLGESAAYVLRVPLCGCTLTWRGRSVRMRMCVHVRVRVCALWQRRSRRCAPISAPCSYRPITPG